jgi:cell division protein ZapA
MAEIDLSIGGNNYTVACRDGEEAHLRSIAAVVDKKADEARVAVGGVSEVRQLLFASLLLADELEEARGGAATAAPGATDGANLAILEDIAVRLETLASRLENRA